MSLAATTTATRMAKKEYIVKQDNEFARARIKRDFTFLYISLPSLHDHLWRAWKQENDLLIPIFWIQENSLTISQIDWQAIIGWILKQREFTF